MTNQHLIPRDEATPDSTLIPLEQQSRTASQPQDINAKINLLEGSLDALQSELDIINKTVAKGLEHLSDSDLDLTSKVAETYKRLGDIESTYKALTVISENIDSEVKKLTEDISDVAAQSAAGLEEQNTQSSQQHEQLVDRMNDLVRHSQETSVQLSRSIEENTDALLRLEKELMAEIDSLANTTNARSDKIEETLEGSMARILQLQAVDDVLEKRAASLEASAAELTRKSRELRASADQLETRTDELSDTVNRLLEHSEKHSSLINALQDKSIEMAMSLKALAGTESRHFKLLSGFLVILVLAIAGLYVHHQSEVRHDAIVTAERARFVDQHITGLQQENSKSAVTLSEVQDNLVTLNQKLEDEVVALNRRLQAMDDRAQTLDGRISSLSPFSRVGGSNVIHGPQWLVSQSAEQYAVQVAAVKQRDDLYAIAQRYNRYLTDELSYYTRGSGETEQYVLLSGGYPSESAAAAVVARLPRYINFQRPTVTRIGEVQKQL